MKLSVCIICRDEEANLPRLFQSLDGLADEIIFVDTGSSDQSINIAQHYQVTILHWTWNHHFGEARNESLHHATGDWILIVDCDDEITSATTSQIREFIQTTEAEACYVRYENLVGDSDREVVMFNKISLFRNRSTYRFRDPIHETIDAAMAEQTDLFRLPISNFVIRHHGYRDQSCVLRKEERNLQLIEKAIEQEGESPFLLYCKAVSQLHLSEYEPALQLLQALKKIWSPADPYLSDVYYKIAVCYYEKKQFELSEKVLNDALKLFPDFTDLYYFLGHIYRLQERMDEAIVQWLTCLNIGEAQPQYTHVQGTGTFLAWQSLAQTYTAIRQYQDAIDAFQHALCIQPNHSLCIQQLLIIIADHVEYTKIASILSETFDLDNPDVLLSLASEAEQARRYELSYALIMYGQEHHTLKDEESARLYRLLRKMN